MTGGGLQYRTVLAGVDHYLLELPRSFMPGRGLTCNYLEEEYNAQYIYC